MSEMVERVAQKILTSRLCDENNGPVDVLIDLYPDSYDLDEARIEARRILWELREPTEAMKRVGLEFDYHNVETLWRQMIDAALE